VKYEAAFVKAIRLWSKAYSQHKLNGLKRLGACMETRLWSSLATFDLTCNEKADVLPLARGLRVMRVLLVEDNEANIEVFRHLAKGINEDVKIDVVMDGEGAIDYLEDVLHKNPEFLPESVFLDLNLPKLSGKEVLKWMRTKGQFDSLPVYIFTSSDYDQDIKETQELGAKDFLTRPLGLNEWEAMLRPILGRPS